MDLSYLKSKIQQELGQKLPGFDAQAQMSPPFRLKYTLEQVEKFEPKESAVLILLYEKNGETYTVFTQRHVYNGAHSGQISLPGGKREQEDINFEATALRETEEEVGVTRKSIEVLGRLSWLYVPPSNFIIHPIIGVLSGEPKFVAEESEVSEIIEVPLNYLLDSTNVTSINIKRAQPKFEFDTPAFTYGSHEIWGATAMIMSEFLDIIGRKK